MAISATTMAIVGIATTVASTGMAIYSNFQQAQAQAEQAQAQSRQYAFQAQQLTLQAQQQAMQAEQTRMGAEQTQMQQEMAMLSARSEATEMYREQLRLHSKQVAQASAAGYDFDSMSFMSVVAATASKADQDREQVLRNGRYNAAGIGVSVQGQLVQAAAQDFTSISTQVSANNAMQTSKAWNEASKNTYGSAWLNSASAVVSGAEKAYGWADKAGWFDSGSTKKSSPMYSFEVGYDGYVV